MEHRQLSTISSQQEMIRFLEMYPLGASGGAPSSKQKKNNNTDGTITTHHHKKLRQPLVMTTSLTPFKKKLMMQQEEEKEKKEEPNNNNKNSNKTASATSLPSPPVSKKPDHPTPSRRNLALLSGGAGAGSPSSSSVPTNSNNNKIFDAQGSLLIPKSEHEETLGALLDTIMKRFQNVVASMSARHAKHEKQIQSFLSSGATVFPTTSSSSALSKFLSSSPTITTTTNSSDEDALSPLTSALRKLLTGTVTPSSSSSPISGNHHHHLAVQQRDFLNKLLSSEELGDEEHHSNTENTVRSPNHNIIKNNNNSNNHHIHTIDTVSREILEGMDVPLNTNHHHQIIDMALKTNNDNNNTNSTSTSAQQKNNIDALEKQLGRLVTNLYDDQYAVRELGKKKRDLKRQKQDGSKNNNNNNMNVQAQDDFEKKEKDRKKRAAGPSSIPVPHALNLSDNTDDSDDDDDHSKNKKKVNHQEDDYYDEEENYSNNNTTDRNNKKYVTTSSNAALPVLSNRGAPKHVSIMYKGITNKQQQQQTSSIMTARNISHSNLLQQFSSPKIVAKSVDDLLPPLFSPQRRQLQILDEQRKIFENSGDNNNTIRNNNRRTTTNNNKPKKDFSLGRKVQGIEVRQHFTVDDAIQNSTATLAAIRSEKERRKSISRKRKQLKSLFPKPDEENGNNNDDDDETETTTSSCSSSESLSSDNSLYDAARINHKIKEKKKQLFEHAYQLQQQQQGGTMMSNSQSLSERRRELQNNFFKDANHIHNNTNPNSSPSLSLSLMGSLNNNKHHHHHEKPKSAASLWCEQAASFARDLLGNLNSRLLQRNIKALTEKQARALLKDDIMNNSKNNNSSSGGGGKKSSFFNTIFQQGDKNNNNSKNHQNDSDNDFDTSSEDEEGHQDKKIGDEDDENDLSLLDDDVVSPNMRKQAKNYLSGELDIGNAKKKSHEAFLQEQREHIKEVEDAPREQYVDGGHFLKSLRFQGNAFLSQEEKNWNKANKYNNPILARGGRRDSAAIANFMRDDDDDLSDENNNNNNKTGKSSSGKVGTIRRRNHHHGGYLSNTSSSTARTARSKSISGYPSSASTLNANPMSYFTSGGASGGGGAATGRSQFRAKKHSLFGPRQFLEGNAGLTAQQYQQQQKLKLQQQQQRAKEAEAAPVAAQKLLYSQQRNVGALARAVTRSFTALSQARNRLARIGITRARLLEMIDGGDLEIEKFDSDDDENENDDDGNGENNNNKKKDHHQASSPAVSPRKTGGRSLRRSHRKNSTSSLSSSALPQLMNGDDDELAYLAEDEEEEEEEEVPLVGRDRPHILSHLFYGSEDELRKEALSDIIPKKEKAISALASEKQIVEALEKDVRTMKGHHETARRETIQRWADAEDVNLKRELIDDISNLKIADKGIKITRSFGVQTPKDFATATNSNRRQSASVNNGESEEETRKSKRVDLSPALESMFENERTLRETLHNLGVATSNISTFMNAMEVDLTCRQCFNIIEHPRTLACGHSFCSSCIPQLLFQIDDDRITAEPGDMIDIIVCSDCKLESPTPGYVSNRLIDKLLEFWQQPQVRNADGIGVEVSRIQKRIQSVMGGVSKTYAMNAQKSAKWIASTGNDLGEQNKSASFRLNPTKKRKTAHDDGTGSDDDVNHQDQKKKAKLDSSSSVVILEDEDIDQGEGEDKKSSSMIMGASSSTNFSSPYGSFRRRSTVAGSGGTGIHDALVMAKTALNK